MSGDVFGNGMLLSRTSAGGGVRSSPHLPRSRSGSGDELRRARAHVQAAALVVGRLRREADLAGGGVHPRSAKSIAITPQVAKALASTPTR
jgi:glutamate dehydrogenase